jgi:hypothetical protein
MSNETLSPAAVKALNAIAGAFEPKEKTVKDAKSIVTIDGRVCTELMTDKEIRTLALKLSTTDAKIEKYALVGNVAVDLPVEIPGLPVADTDVETDEENEEVGE